MRRRGRGFTLMELLLVVGLMGLVAAVTVVSVGGGHASRLEREAMGGVVGRMSLERLEAMRSASVRVCRLRVDEDALVLTSAGGEERSWRVPGLEVVEPEDRRPPERRGGARVLEVSFAPDGRTDQRAWRFAAAGGSDTLWTLAFDPVSGVPRASRSAEDGER